LFTVLILILVYGAYVLWLKPARMMKFYAKFLKDKGYRVYENSFNPLKYHLADVVIKGNKHGDAMRVHK
jgi:hypothetical protein